jgi:hypothetical protein
VIENDMAESLSPPLRGVTCLRSLRINPRTRGFFFRNGPGTGKKGHHALYASTD